MSGGDDNEEDDMARLALAPRPTTGVVSAEFIDDRNDRTRPYGLDVCEMTRLDKIVQSAPWHPEDALAAVLGEFGEAEKRAAAIAHLLDPERRRWPKGTR